MLKPGPEAIVEVGGMKSANTHLHLMEALTELYDATHDPEVRKSLEEAVRINATYFYPLKRRAILFPSPPGLEARHRAFERRPFVRAQRRVRLAAYPRPKSARPTAVLGPLRRAYRARLEVWL